MITSIVGFLIYKDIIDRDMMALAILADVLLCFITLFLGGPILFVLIGYW